MYQPKFENSHKIVNNIAEISAAREIVLNARVVPVYDLLLRDNAIKKSAYASTAIEGNPLTPEQVDDVIKGEEIDATEKAKKEVSNYYEVIDKIRKYQSKGKISKNHILKLHYDITKGTLNKPECEGRFRDSLVAVVNGEGAKRYIPPNHDKIPILMGDFIEWLNTPNQINPVLLAGIAHYELVSIHPFRDGNGRTARALATLILYFKKFDIKRYFVLDEYYNIDRERYVDALNSADRTHDLTNWLEYFSDGVLSSILKVKEEVLRLSPESRRRGEEGQIRLNENQRIIFDFTYNNRKIQNSDVQNLLNITPPGAYKVLNKMLDLNILDKKGKGPGTYYVLKY